MGLMFFLRQKFLRLRTILVVALVSFSFGCTKEKSGSGGDSGAVESLAPSIQPDAESPPAGSSSGAFVPPARPTTTVDSTVASSGFGLTRVTPEQLSNNLHTAVNFGHDPNEFRFYNSYLGQYSDYLQILFGVSLGGVDFETTSIRDYGTKAQTLLVSRVVAIQFAQMAIGKEWNKPANGKVIFTLADLATDRPFRDADLSAPAATQTAIRAGEARWNLQLDELFYRFFARPPSEVERGAVKSAFLAGMDSEGNIPAGWTTVFYALLATQEFWHR